MIVGLCIWLPVSVFAVTIPAVDVKRHPIQRTQLKQGNYLQIITDQQIQRSGATSIAAVLANQGGIQLEDLTGDGSNVSVSMRGFGGNAATNTLILINGIPQNNPDLSTPNFNRIPIQDVRRIVILQGSQSVRYGNEAVAGVINIITKTPQKSRSNASIGYGSYHHQIYHYDVSNAYHNGFHYLFSATKNKTDNYRHHNNDNQNNLHLQLGYDYKTGKVNLDYTFYNQRLLYAGALTQQQLQENRRQAQNTFNFETNFQHNIDLNWQQQAGDNWTITTHFNNRHDTAHGFLYGNFTQSQHSVLLDPTAVGYIDRTKITTGISARHDTYTRNSNYGDVLEQRNIVSGFGIIEQPLYKALSLTAGLRAARLDPHNHPVVSEIGLRYALGKKGLLYIKNAGSYRFPKTEENADRPLNSPPLKTQTGNSIDVGFKWFAAHYHLNLNAYQMSLHNEIVFDPLTSSTQPFGANRNLSPTHRLGANLALDFPINAIITLGAEYSYVDARFDSGQNKHKKIPFVASNILHLSTTLHFAHHWTAYSELLFTGQRFASGDESNTHPIVPALTVVNANIGYTRDRYEINCRWNNIFNEHYNSNVVYEAFGNQEYFYPAAGTNVMLTATVKLW